MTLPPTRASGPYRPTRLGDWEVIAKIAGGGMSAVFLGRRVESATEAPNVVALKVMRYDVGLDAAYRRMFADEARLITRLVHPNIVRTLEVDCDAEQAFIAMELMRGKTFAAIHDAVAARGVRLNPEIAAWAAARIAGALHYAHELRDASGAPLALVHRDVNPANVFATFDGEVKLFDFGLAKITAKEREGSQVLAGKLSYLSPEQIMQMPLDRRSDVFSLGTTLWELLTGKRLFLRDTDAETVRAVQLGPIPDPRAIAPDVPEELARITKAALERNREHRYPTAERLARDLDAFVFAHPSHPHREPVTAADVRGRLARLVDALFPGEQKRQSGWLKPAIGGSRSMPAPATLRDGTASVRPPSTSPSVPPRAISRTDVQRLAPSAPPPASVPPRPSGSPPRPRRPPIPLPSKVGAPAHARGTSPIPTPPDSQPTDVDFPGPATKKG